ncbi:MAG: ATP-binding protein [Polyangiaceae bacterium]
MPPNLEQLLTQQRDAIVARFVADVQREGRSPRVAPSLVVDHIPQFLDEVIAELARSERIRAGQDAADTSATAREHGGQRWRLGYDLAEVIREYGVLRHCILETAKEQQASICIDEVDVLEKCLAVGMAEAATAYIRSRDTELAGERARLAFLAEAGQLLSSSLDYRSTLSRLTGLIVPRLADWSAVHLSGVPDAEMPIAHVDPAKGELLRELFTRFPPPPGSPYGHLQVVQSALPQLVSHIEPAHYEELAQSDAHLALMRAIGTCSFIIVPLRVQSAAFGALMLAYSDSGRHYDEASLTLVAELARSAAAAIDNARLYDLSQKERSRAEAAARAKDEFVAMVSHELRTPLGSILGWLRLIRGGLPAEKQQHAFDVIERNANAQNRLVSDLLDISTMIAGRLRVTLAQVDLANIVDMGIEGLAPAAEAKRIRVVAELDRAHATLRGDGERLQQVVWNLLANAIKFTPKNGQVSVRLRRIASELELVVQDDGEGITAEFLPQVFESFRQYDTTTSRRHGGLGVGLSISKQLVELHGGSIEARSDGLGHGATFVVRLPVSPVVSSTVGVGKVPATRPEPGELLPTGLHGVKVLVVDDERDARDLVAYVLESTGMEVRLAGGGAEALGALATWTPHVVISDVGMPDEDGYSLIRAIRTLPSENRNTPAIALTAFVGNEHRTKALLAGFNVYMAKPVEPAALVRAVLDLVGAPRS